jgi:acyl-CoA hydrolase
MTEKRIIHCNKTQVIACHRIFAEDLNEHQTLFGGRILDFVDRQASVSAMRVARTTVVTATVDHVDFIAPFKIQDSMCLHSYVTGMGHRSLEVFAKMIGENLSTGDRFLGFTCFMTFVIDDKNISLPDSQLVPDTKEQETLCAGYDQRVALRRQTRNLQGDLGTIISTDLPW